MEVTGTGYLNKVYGWTNKFIKFGRNLFFWTILPFVIVFFVITFLLKKNKTYIYNPLLSGLSLAYIIINLINIKMNREWLDPENF